MSGKLEYDDRGGYLKVGLVGTPDLETFKQQVAELLGECIRRGHNKVLVDASGLTGLLGALERYELGVHFETVWNRTIRLAAVVEVEDLAEHRFFEDVARNRGIIVQMFTDEQAALDWLESGFS